MSYIYYSFSITIIQFQAPHPNVFTYLDPQNPKNSKLNALDVTNLG